MKLIRYMAIFILVVLPVSLMTGCSAEGTSIRLLVIVNSNEFSGYYIKNGDEIKNFGDTTADAYNMYQYEEDIENVDYLEVSVTAEAGATSASIKIYKDNEKVKDESITGLDTGYPHTITLDYEYGEGESEEE